MLDFISNPTLVTGSVCLLAVLLVAVMFWGFYRDARKERGRIAQAIPATARITRVGNSDTTNGGMDVDLTFEVTPPDGAPYTVKTTWSVEPLSVSKIQPGSTVAIKIDAKDPKKIYSAEKWAWALGQMRPDAGSDY